jgi:predicted NUDIX family NTP pyrophosphohydrolase
MRVNTMTKKSAGILMYRYVENAFEVLLVHPGGPFWSKRDVGAWSIPKGEFGPNEDPETSAKREFAEELGIQPEGDLLPLGEIRQRGGKVVIAFALRGNFDVSVLRSNTFEIEWPPRSGKVESFPEVDRAEWFDLTAARDKIIEGQRPFLDRIIRVCHAGPAD